MSLIINNYISDLSKLKPLVHLIEDLYEMIAAVVSKINLVENDIEWIVDTCASKHLCANREMFTKFENVVEGEQVYMGNSSNPEVLGKGKILLKFTSGKIIALNNVLYVPVLRGNLISCGLLNKTDIKLVFEYEKLVLSHNGNYIGKGFLSGRLFVIDIVSNVSTSAYTIESLMVKR
ncbi:hypothetical protein ES288_D05G356500v1 [Gossypium darwinii]|uniref:Retrovirus-related Pol polyprotein from transposon TNT 1-94-like beta-barrel domain-containing protein n=1 Tax=Gossypium darwinii TaxID=34276 RepID=A0A5D2CNB9_GOSDA|nr:hypothetical protein ES288_D05G356500v1 [Gossypium darwinii]